MSLFQIIPTSFEKIKSTRNEYLRSLPEFQELYLELMVPSAKNFIITIDSSHAGYVLLNTENIMFEFYLHDSYISQSKEIFRHIVQELGVKRIYCKSFDYLLYNCCITESYPHQIIGALYRNYNDVGILVNPNLSYRLACDEDIPFLLKQEDGLYESPSELEMFVKGQNISMFYEQGNFIGCGFYIKVHTDWNFVDIGMWVHPAFRRHGFATQIISVLKENCIKNNKKPICGCDIHNSASQKTLEKCGFISKHKLFEYGVQ